MKKTITLAIVFIVGLTFIYIVQASNSLEFPINSLPDNSIFYSITSILVVLWSEKNKIFDNFLIRLVFIVLIVLGALSAVFNFLINNQVFKVITSLTALTIMVLLTVVTIKRLFANQVSNDVIILKFRVMFKIRKLNRKFDIACLTDSIDQITLWSTKNIKTKKNNNDIRVIVGLYEVINNLITENKYKIQDATIENNDGLDKLKESYLQFYLINQKAGLETNFIESILKIVKHFYNVKSRSFLEYYLTIIHEFIERDFSLSSKASDGFRFGRSIVGFLEFISESYTENNELNPMILKSMKLCMYQFDKYSFDISDKVTILILQEYVNAVLHLSKNGYDLTDISELRSIVHNLHSKCIPRNLKLFYDSRLDIIIKSSSDSDIKVEIMHGIFQIVFANKYDKSVLNRIVKMMESIVESESSSKYVERYLELLSKIDESSLNYYTLGKVFDHFISIELEKRDLYFESSLGKLLDKKENISYLFNQLIDYSNSENIDDVQTLTNFVIGNIYYNDINMSEISFSRFFKKVFDLITSKNVNDSDKMIEAVNYHLKNIDDFIRFSGNVSVNLTMISLLSDYLDNKVISNRILDFLLKSAYVAIESNESEIYNKVSNSIGWHLFRLIQNRLKGQSTDEINSIKYVFRNYISFYKEICEFRDKDSVFVGTVAVVNLSLVDSIILDSKSIEDKKYFQTIKSYMISELKRTLTDEQRNQIKKSAQIRKYSIDSFIECSTKSPKEIANRIFIDSI